LDKRDHLFKIILTYVVTHKQTNNGVWCKTEELSNELIEVIYDYLLVNLR